LNDNNLNEKYNANESLIENNNINDIIIISQNTTIENNEIQKKKKKKKNKKKKKKKKKKKNNNFNEEINSNGINFLFKIISKLIIAKLKFYFKRKY